MRIKYNKFRDALSGTPLESLTDNQIKEAIIGEYPLSLSSKHLHHLWRIALSEQSVEIEKLKRTELDMLLQAMSAKTLRLGNKEQHEKVEDIRKYLRKSVQNKAVLELQANIIRTQEEDILRYEIKSRELKGYIKDVLKEYVPSD